MSKAPYPERELTSEHIERLNIGARYRNAKVSDLPKGPFRTCLVNYGKSLDDMWSEGVGIVACGPNGSGKTHGISALFKLIYSKGYPSYIIASENLRQSLITQEMFDSEQSVKDRAYSVPFLLIDDLGKEYRSSKSEWAALSLDSLLRSRTKRLLPTFITTNLSPKALVETYDQSIASILKDLGVLVRVAGEDYRKTNMEEMRRRLMSVDG